MGILDKLTNNTNNSNSPSQSGGGEFSLSQQEIELLLSMIKDSHFRGDVLELLYGTVYKLQQQYITITQ
jgi:hypothetical protein